MAALSRHRTSGRWTLLRRFAKGRQGVAAVEFAIVFPVLLILVAGSIDTSEALSASGRSTNVAATLAGFLADQNRWTTADVDELITAGSFMMRPYEAGSVKITLSVLKVAADGTARVTASRALGTTPLVVGSISPVAVPRKIGDPAVNLVLSQVDYSLATPFSALWPGFTVNNRFRLVKHYFARPRQNDTIVIQ
jgi:Flp pilus assembly protein TadG